MTLINYPKRGREALEDSKVSPHCGHPIAQKLNWQKNLMVSRNKKAIILAIILMTTVVMLWLVFRLSPIEKEEVDKVIQVIYEIGDTGLNSGQKIIKAETLYGNLPAKLRLYVSNKNSLKNARDSFDRIKAENTKRLIERIGNVDDSSQSDILIARKNYDDLTDAQRRLVSNYDVLLESEKVLSSIKIQKAEDAIKKIGNVTLDSQENINEAKKLINTLTESEKSNITNLSEFKEAQTEYNELVVNECINLIDSIGDVSLESKSIIEDAEELYSLLPLDEKDNVRNYSKLKMVEETYKDISEITQDLENTLMSGDTFGNKKWKVTYSGTNITPNILPNSQNGYYLYYYANDNETFIDCIFNIKNIGTDIFEIDDIIGVCKVKYQGRTLNKLYALYLSSDSDVSQVYLGDGLDALGSTTLHVVISMPYEIQYNDESIKV